MRKLLLLLVISMSFSGITQECDTLKVMSYNLLKFPGGSPERIDTLKDILAYVKPDIFMVCELTSGSGANSILFNALNEGGESAYDMADYIGGPDTENMLYFNTDKLGLIEQHVIPTDLRDINEYVLYYKSDDIASTTDTTFFYVYVCHLKASTGFEEQRNNEAIALKTYMNSRPNKENILIGGDFNLYGSDVEPAWNTILTGGDITIKDPLTLPGHWHNDPGYAWAHTQSTRTEEFGGGAYGGMDDRFDFIFIGEDLKTYANDALYINNSYKAIGQDGLHFNKSLIEAPTNNSVPAPILSNLYHMSDHLPIYLEIEVVKEGASLEEENQPKIEAYYNAESSELVIRNGKTGTNYTLFDLSGKKVQELSLMSGNTIDVNWLEPGAYILRNNENAGTFKFVKP